MMMVVYGNNDPIEVNVAGFSVAVHHFHRTLSKRNTPVKKSRFPNTNIIPDCWLFITLDPSSHLDVFCLHRVFLPSIQATMDRHYESLKVQKKRKSTLNPSYPAGTYRRSHLYESAPSCAKAITATTAARLRAVGLAYWARRPESLAPRHWERDPVVTAAGRARRARLVARRAPAALEEEYRAFRWCTLDLSARGL